ncbi:ABC transporter ATP-binding protein [Streptomyces griseoruber]|uniref:ABC transporter ATP-binding protein n=1 Tax=Streptomyces griseoruber TaxID=1943 RepID=UPI0037B7BDCD
MTPVLSVRGIEFRYGDGPLITHGIDLEIGSGETVVLLGPNGAGKSTLIKQITGELRSVGGEIEIMGHAAHRRKPAGGKPAFGAVPQSAGLFDRLTVARHLSFFAEIKGFRRRAAHAEAARIAELCGLLDLMGTPVGDLSGGQARLVLIGIAMIGDPPLLILDEPTVGLDAEIRRRVWALIQSLAANGKAVLLTTHYLEEAEKVANRIDILWDGKIQLSGTLIELFEQIDDSYEVTVQLTNSTSDRVVTRFRTRAEAEQFIRDNPEGDCALRRCSLEDLYLRIVERRGTDRGQAIAGCTFTA